MPASPAPLDSPASFAASPDALLVPHPDRRHLAWMLGLGLAPVAEPAVRLLDIAREPLSRAGAGSGVVLTLTTACFASVLGIAVARTKGVGGRLAALVGGAMALGCANTVAAALGAGLLGSHDPAAALGTALLAGLFSPVFGAPLGLACGLAALVPVVALGEKRSALHADVGFGVASVWTATFWLVALAAFPESPHRSVAPEVVGALASLLGALGTARAAFRATARRAFLARVQADLEPAYRLRVASEGGAAAGDAAAPAAGTLAGVPSLDGGTALVLETLEASTDPYRSAVRARAVATLSSSPARAR